MKQWADWIHQSRYEQIYFQFNKEPDQSANKAYFQDISGASTPLGEYVNNRINTKTMVEFVLRSFAHSTHQSLDQLEQRITPDILEQVRTHQPLANITAVDLGCGEPTYARILRLYGATVITVDAVDIDQYPAKSDSLASKDATKEREHHIVGDLNQPSTLDKLIAYASDADIVSASTVYEHNTPSHIFAPTEDRLQLIAQTLLFEGGVYLSSEKASLQIKETNS